MFAFHPEKMDGELGRITNSQDYTLGAVKPCFYSPKNVLGHVDPKSTKGSEKPTYYKG